MRNCLGVVLLFFLASCNKSDLPDFNKIEGPRILAIVADKPEANPGDTINITPVISDVNTTAGLEDTIQVCVDLGIAFGAEPTCENNPTKVIVQNHRVLTLPGLAENWTGLADGASFSIPADIIMFYQKSDQEKYNGVNYLIEYILYSSSGVTIKAIKRIVVTEASKVTKNQNPVMTDITSDGVSMVNLPINTKVILYNDLTGASAESYSLKGTNGNLKNYTEDLIVTWFITDGTTKNYRSYLGNTNEYTGPEVAPTGRSAFILAVAHDNRGGVSVVKRKLN